MPPNLAAIRLLTQGHVTWQLAALTRWLHKKNARHKALQLNASDLFPFSGGSE